MGPMDMDVDISEGGANCEFRLSYHLISHFNLEYTNCRPCRQRCDQQRRSFGYLPTDSLRKANERVSPVSIVFLILEPYLYLIRRTTATKNLNKAGKLRQSPT